MQNEILNNRKQQLIKLKEYLLLELKELDVQSIMIFGSATNPTLFDKEHSDIDIIAYTDALKRPNVDNILTYLNQKGGNFQDKQPIYIEDFITPRIEYFYNIDGVDFDINIFPNQIWGYDEIKTKVLHDALDIFFGGMNQYAISLYNQFEPLEKIKEDIYPFYSDDIRESRLDILETRIMNIIKKIKSKIDNNERDLFEYVLKTRTYFIKWLFIMNRVYPIDLYKHLEYQFKEMLSMKEEDIDTILFRQEVSPKKLVLNYMNLVENNLEKRR